MRASESKSVPQGVRWAGGESESSEEPGAKKRAILRAAATLFREHGYERTRLNDIARALNVTKPALYYYVKNKEDILVEIQQTGFDEIMDELTELRRGAQSGADALRRVIVRYANWVTGEFGVCVARHFLITLAPHNLARLRRGRRTVERRIRETIARGVEDGSLRDCEPWVVATVIVGALNWMAYWYEAGPGRRSAGELGNAYFELLMQGVGALRVAPAPGRVGTAKRKPGKGPAS